MSLDRQTGQAEYRERAMERQRRLLERLLARGRACRFGSDHELDELDGLEDYRLAVPLRSHDEFWSEYWQEAQPTLDGLTWPGHVPYFALTAGTTSGRSRRVPYTRVQLNGYRRGLAAACDSASRSTLTIGPSAVLEVGESGVRTGALAGLLAAEAAPSRPWGPAPEFAGVRDVRERFRRLAAASFGADLRTIVGMPTWLLAFVEELRNQRPFTTLQEVFPNLECIVTTGESARPFAVDFERLAPGVPRTELYAATEGVIGVREPTADAFRLLTNTGLFYEFIPLGELASVVPERHWVGDVENGVAYAIAITNAAGLWAYLLGDVVEFTDVAQLRFHVLGRLNDRVSVFGEHLSGAEVEAALATAGLPRGGGFSAGMRLRAPADASAGGWLEILAETSEIAEHDRARITAAAAAVDAAIRARNRDFDEFRAFGVLDATAVVPIAPGSFADWLSARAPALAGQTQVPRVFADPIRYEAFRAALLGNSSS